MNPEQRLAGKVILVTGGSRGIGREIVLLAVEQGAQVAFCSRRGKKIVNAKDEKRTEFGSQLLEITADVTQLDDVEKLFSAVKSKFGRVDVVINNAGNSHSELLVSLTTKTWNEIMAINLTGAFLVAKYAVNAFLNQGSSGQIISIGSVTQNGAPADVSYAASKGGLVGLTKMINSTYNQNNIYAHLIVGGYIDAGLMKNTPETFRTLVTDMIPQKRMGRSCELANYVLFLATNPGISHHHPVCIGGGLIDPPII